MPNFAIQAKAQDINFVAKFNSDLHNLMNVLGKTGVDVLAPGTAFKTYKASGTLASGTVAEKALIPDSGIAMGDAELTEVTYAKYRNLVSIEDVAKKGYDVAVGGSNDVMLRQIQKSIRASIFAAIAKGTGTAKAADFQAKVAQAAAFVTKAFEDEACTPVIFASPDDAYTYLGAHNVTLENQYGLSYLQSFMGIGNVIIDSNVPNGTVYGTATENLSLVAASLASVPGMDLTTDETGIVAVHNDADYSHAALEVVAYTGVAVLPVFTDRIVKVTTAA